MVAAQWHHVVEASQGILKGNDGSIGAQLRQTLGLDVGREGGAGDTDGFD